MFRSTTDRSHLSEVHGDIINWILPHFDLITQPKEAVKMNKLQSFNVPADFTSTDSVFFLLSRFKVYYETASSSEFTIFVGERTRVNSACLLAASPWRTAEDKTSPSSLGSTD